jgi:peptide/nickel transport system ATP-binding protein
MSEAPLLQVRDLRKTFVTRELGGKREVHAVAGVSFEIAAGEIVALVGTSGSGKSTIGRLITRLERPTAGELRWRGAVLADEARTSRAFRHGVQLIFQDPFAALNPARRIGHHLERPLALAGKARGKAALAAGVTRLLQTVGLGPAMARRFPHELSGGQRQRVCVARALAVEPALVVADEPTSMLDASLRAELLALLVAVTRDRGRAMLYITHDLGAARAIADRVLVLDHGRIVEAGPTAAVLDAPAHPHTRALMDAIPDPLRGFAASPNHEHDRRE